MDSMPVLLNVICMIHFPFVRDWVGFFFLSYEGGKRQNKILAGDHQSPAPSFSIASVFLSLPDSLIFRGEGIILLREEITG